MAGAVVRTRKPEIANSLPALHAALGRQDTVLSLPSQLVRGKCVPTLVIIHPI